MHRRKAALIRQNPAADRAAFRQASALLIADSLRMSATPDSQAQARSERRRGAPRAPPQWRRNPHTIPLATSSIVPGSGTAPGDPKL